MLARILCVSDLHKRWKESDSIKGSIDAQIAVQEDLIKFNRENGITHNIILGDWYDRGFHGLGQAYGAIEMDRRLSASVNGNVYLCIGNHFYLERDSNPEMYIIQPNDLIKPQTPIPVPDEPIFKLVQTLMIGSVQISFFHFNKINKTYVSARPDNVTFHIGIYHDDSVVPGWVRELDGYSGVSTQAYYNDIYANVDLAIHGHIHTKVGFCKMDLLSGRSVPLYIPGSLGITQNKESEKHISVDLPVIEINDDSTVNVTTAQFTTHMEMLRFFEPKSRKKHTLVQDGVISQDQLNMIHTGNTYTSLYAYLGQKGYNDVFMKMVDAANSESLGFIGAMEIIREGTNINE